MLWLHALDTVYYNDAVLIERELRTNHEKIKISIIGEIVKIFGPEQLEKALAYAAKSGKRITILSPLLPVDIVPPSAQGYFSVVELANRHGLLTTTDVGANVSSEEKLEKLLGMKVHHPQLSFDDMAGATIVKEKVNEALLTKSVGIPFRGVLLVGIFGTGKSHFAKCFAGETGRSLVELSLAKLLYTPNPIAAFNQVVAFLQEQRARYVLWLDEIDKMFTGNEISTHLLNAYLTFQNEIGRTLDIDVIVVATANKIDKIMKSNPETFRAGRFDLRFYLDFPRKKTAYEVFTLHVGMLNGQLEHRYYVGLKNYLAGELTADSPFAPFMGEAERQGRELFKRLENMHQGNTLGVQFEKEFVNFASHTIDVPEAFIDRFRIDMDIELLVNEIAEYDFHGKNESERAYTGFPYVHAEIENLAQQIFALNAAAKIQNVETAIKRLAQKMCEANIPLAMGSREATNSMQSAQEFFTTVS